MKSGSLKRRSSARYVPTPDDYEPGGGVSQTIQDDSYSLKDLLKKFTAGVQVGGRRNPVYDQEDETNFDAPDREKFSRMDLPDRAEVIAEQREASERQLELFKSRSVKPPKAAQKDEQPAKEAEDDVQEDEAEKPERRVGKGGSKKAASTNTHT